MEVKGGHCRKEKAHQKGQYNLSKREGISTLHEKEGGGVGKEEDDRDDPPWTKRSLYERWVGAGRKEADEA